ncbi:TIGR02680 family protein [Goekera deserti]|uniref:TIGR02680 family protein n=1 Tax=Goekera deserti TaxID=2497753 RepID=A0A7K3WI52_9ACTN|nr:TIGR02680 family protein [Goekera deserti]NDI47304.1 TIGR02680 family protein [Goekera deserti]NEL56134.1 TIGR02680 family protein [Goekera deserti]
MTATLPTPAEDLGQAPLKRYDSRWRLHRGGIVNVWFYYDEQFTFSGGRVIWRGTNGAGKSRALEMLLPFLLDADRRNIDATGAKKVRLEDLMSHGAGEQTNRVGYLWLELEGEADDGSREYLTLGAFIRFSKATAEAKAWYFVTPLRVGADLPLLGEDREPLSRERLTELVGAERITEKAETHRDRVRADVFGLTGEAGKQRYAGLLQLLHVLRNPDVGNRIEAGELPKLVSAALPPLSDVALSNAGQQLDALSETRATQQALEEDAGHLAGFLDSYRRYVAGVLLTAGGAAREAAGSARAAAAHARTETGTHEKLIGEHAAAAAELTRLTARDRELDGTILGIRTSQEYKDATQLDDVERRVAALHTAAAGALTAAGSAREHEAHQVQAADGRATEVAQAADRAATTLREAQTGLQASGMDTDVLPAAAAAQIGEDTPLSEPVRTDVDTDPQPAARPVPHRLTVTPTDPRAAAEAARRVQQAADRRAGQAGTRLATAQDLQRRLTQVERAEDNAEAADRTAEISADDAATAADLRDTVAATLAAEWRRWTGDATTTTLLGDVSWADTAAGPLLADAEALTGDGGAIDLTDLDRVAAEAAEPARERLADERADLRRRQEQDDQRRTDLDIEARGLRAERDPEPLSPPWQTAAPDDSMPLWQALDFTDPDLPDIHKGGIEGALHAAGLLTAHLSPTGTVTAAAAGQVLLAPAGPRAARPLSQLLTADPESPAEPTLVADVLARIALDDATHPVWVGTDGSWGNGPLRGHHPAAAARHIGAAARAASRAARLAEITAEVDRLDEADAARAAERGALREREQALTAHLRTAPRSGPLTQARAAAVTAATRADRDEQAAVTARTAATRLRDAWAAAHAQHVEACRAFGLPTDTDALATIRRDATAAAGACGRLAGRLAELGAAVDRHAAALTLAATATGKRRAAEAGAENEWGVWRAADAEVAALRASVGAEATAIRARLQEAETEAKQVKSALGAAVTVEGDLGRQASAAEERVRHAEESAATARAALAAAVDRLRAITALRGLAAAVTDGQTLPDLPPADPVTIAADDVDAAVRRLESAVNGRGDDVDTTAILRAQQNLERDLQGTFDVFATDVGGVWLFDLVDATGTHTIASGHDLLQRRTTEGRTALTERERTVFTDFVLGGVAEELRDRLKQARELIDAMNDSLDTIRTSHGIGVRVNWNLAVADDDPLARIRQLVTLSGEVRRPEQDAELIALITARVEDFMSHDPTAGYATHLTAALDYRKWHEVEPLILGPAPGQKRTISRRSKLSQGETRFVSYVTLFAAIDAYLSGLPDVTRALRLIVLDDAFAKVDNRTIGVLMGLLVRLDIDFAMTGHALWGTYPQVPSLDVYEVRRREGSAAITTHVHWDGHTRHLRVAP